MESLNFIDADTLKLTIIPGLIVLVVLFFWFRRSEPRAPSIRQRDVHRSRFSANDALDDDYVITPGTKADSTPEAVAESFINSVEEESPGGHRFHYNDDYIPDPLDDWEPVQPKAVRTKAPTVERGVSPSKAAKVSKATISKKAPEPIALRDESPSLDDENDIGESDDELPHEAPVTAARPKQTETVKGRGDTGKASPPQDDLILVLSVVGNGHNMRGSAMLKALTATGMSFGRMNIFHYVGPNRPATRPLFSVANMMEPGSFNLATMEELATPGVTLFANVSRPEEATATFSVMLETARQLARTLDGIVCDEKRSTLTKQGIEHIHARISDFQRRSRLARAANA